jgi:hypothetical protein
MKKRPVGFSIAIALLALFALWSFASCDGVLGSDDDDDSGGGSGGGAEVTSWIFESDTSLDHPFGGTYRVAIIDKGESQMTIVFYHQQENGDGVVQVAGGLLPYEVEGEAITYEWSHAWLDHDPDIQGITYSGKDWYEIPADAEAPGEGTMQIDGDTLTVDGGGGELAFSKVEFGLPADMVGTWNLDLSGSTGDLELGTTSDAPVSGWGSLSYTHNTEEGSGYWQATGTTEGYFRQIYTEISDEADLEYWEYLTPYALADDTWTFYSDLAKTEGGAYDYIR